MMQLVAQNDSMLLLIMQSDSQWDMQRCILIISCLIVNIINLNVLQFFILQAEGLVASALAFLVNHRLSSHEGSPVTDFQQAMHYSHRISFFLSFQWKNPP